MNVEYDADKDRILIMLLGRKKFGKKMNDEYYAPKVII